MKLYLVGICLVAIAVTVDALCLSQLCSGNRNNALRGCDSQGCGHHGARRGSRTHDGVDILCSPGSSVYAPFSSRIVRVSRPYSSNSGSYNDGLLIRGTGSWSGYEAKIWYFDGTSSRGNVNAGSYIGTSQRLPYSGITQHLHLQLKHNGRSVNPSNYIC